MAITHTETVSDLIVLNDGTDVVSQVVIKTVSVDDSDPLTLTQTYSETFHLDTSGGTGASGFVSYSSLSETLIKSWIADELAASKVKTNAEALINSIKTPSTPIEINKELPW